jgi:hypothetical protein
MSEAKKKEHPFKRILKAYGITMGMVANYLGVSHPYGYKMLRGEKPMPKPIEWKLQKLVDRLQNPVFEDAEGASEAVVT